MPGEKSAMAGFDSAEQQLTINNDKRQTTTNDKLQQTTNKNERQAIEK